MLYLFYLSYKLNFITNYESNTASAPLISLIQCVRIVLCFQALLSYVLIENVLPSSWHSHLNTHMRVWLCEPKKSYTFMKSCEIIHVTVLSSLTSSYFYLFVHEEEVICNCSYSSQSEFDTFLPSLFSANLYTSFINFVCLSDSVPARVHHFFVAVIVAVVDYFVFAETAFQKFRNLTHIWECVRWRLQRKNWC